MKDINERVDNLFPQGKSRRKRIGKMGKIALVCVISGLLVLTASATYITFFNEVNTTINVVQGVQMDGQDYDSPISHTIDDAMGGCCYCFEHTVKNDGCDPVWLDFTETGIPDLDGIDIKYLLPESSCCDHELESLVIRVLDGLAETYDDFEVYVDGILVYTYSAVGGGVETWEIHIIDLTPAGNVLIAVPFVCCGPHTIEIKCTATSAWSGHATYGQLGVDTIALYCEGHVLCDSVDIGDLTSESTHAVTENPDWGPIVPPPGGWGGFDQTGETCRAVWEPGTGGDDNCRWASCILTCADCYELGGCNCDTGTPVEFPIHLEHGESLNFCICYDLAVLIQKGTYSVQHHLVPV